MITEFDIVFDKICDDVFPRISDYVEEQHTPEQVSGYVDIHDMIEFLTDVEGYDTDMAHRIWESYIEVNHKFIELLHSEK
jgi:hypothetical protein